MDRSVASNVDSYNETLELLDECFEKSNHAFVEAVDHLRPLNHAAGSRKVCRQMEADGRVLLAIASRFIELYL